MAGTYHIMNIGWTAMMTHRLSSDVAGHNIANAATPGYARQRAELMANMPWLTRAGPVGTGVDAIGINHLKDSLLERSLIGAAADYGFSSGRMSVLQPAQASLGIGDDDRVNDAMNGFFSALSDLAQDPAGAVQRDQVLAAAGRLGDSFAQVRDQLDRTRHELDRKVEGMTDAIQARIDEIAVLNREIQITEAAGGQANDLRDRRALLAREVGDRIGVATFGDDEGNLNLMLITGGVLVEGTQSATITAVADPANAGLLSPVLVAPSGAQTRLGAQVLGELGGLLSARDTELRGAIDDLDTLAFELAGQVNAVHQAGVGLDGVGARDLFAPIGAVAGAAANLQLDAALVGNPDALAAALDPAAIPGDNRNALALADLADTAFLGGGTRTPGAFWREAVSRLGAGLDSAERDTELHGARLEQLTAMRESVSGVSIDEEMIELAKAQRAFEAASKVIQTGDELLQTVLDLKR